MSSRWRIWRIGSEASVAVVADRNGEPHNVAHGNGRPLETGDNIVLSLASCRRKLAAVRLGRMRSVVWRVRSAAMAACCLWLVACNQPLAPIFDSGESARVWPSPPLQPRIRYVGELKSDKSLKPPAKLFAALGDLLLGPTQPQPLYGPRSVVLTEEGQRLWVADPGGRCVHVFCFEDRSYRKLTQAGETHFLCPVGVCPGPAGMIYVCDSEGVTIDLFDAANGRHVESVPLVEDIDRPVALTYNASSEELFVVDAARHDIKVIDGEGRLLRILGRRGALPGEFNFPCAIAADRDHLWVADAGNCRVQCITRDGKFVQSIGQAGDSPGDLALPKAVALDSEGHIYVVDARFENIQIFNAQGQLLLYFGEEGEGPGEFWLPSGIFIDSADRLWVCDSYNERIQAFDYLPATPNATTATGGSAGANP